MVPDLEKAVQKAAMRSQITLLLRQQFNIIFQDFKFQVSGYAGGTVGLNQRSADSLGLDNGAFRNTNLSW